VVSVSAYLPATDGMDARLSEVRRRLRVLEEAGVNTAPAALSVARIEAEDWAEAWRAHFHVEHVAPNLVVKPTWEAYAAQPGETVIEMDPGMAFGTGNHPTTQTCLAALAEILTGGERANLEGDLAGGFYVKPTVFKGHNKMRIFQEEIFGPVLSVTTFKDEEEALAIANDTLYGLGAGVWTRSIHKAYRMGRAIQAGRVWTNCYHLYPAHAAFGGYKQSGIGRENHKMMLDHYQQTKNMLVSYDPKAMGFF